MAENDRGRPGDGPGKSGSSGRERVEGTLGRQFLARDAGAVARTREMVARIVRFHGYMIPAADRDDLVQEVMLQIWEALRKPAFDFSGRFESFVQVVAARRCIDWMRTRKPVSAINPAIPHDSPGPLDKLMQHERRALAREALSRLKESCRELIRLHVGEKLPYARIAERTGRSEGALRFQMYECIRQARQILDRIAQQHDDPNRGTARSR